MTQCNCRGGPNCCMLRRLDSRPHRGTYQTCPKCNGQKMVNTPPWVPGDQATYFALGTGSYQCPVCNGLGMVESPR